MGRSWSSYEESSAPAKKTADAAPPAKPFNYTTLRHKLVFGGLVGLSTGLTFGSVDAVRQAHTQYGRINAQAIRSISRTAGICGMLFSGFFFSYQGIKTTMEQLRGAEDFANVGVAALLSGAPFIRHPVMRTNAMYAALLVGLDLFHEEINGARP
ncbi:hypothetical protein SDRG_07187 [Saprolegnia diclina VS20]|uniref:Mitochondrial import inner membrane translocase subunit TIM22 n=1 Tax=Saprolegnia diclina (strain VS20) TaxID=1156394 RepID=T0QC91_SAPDV|nr:hypothetical protein SDRG_07187 [Saprolegnia diclina VS20]EQC35479.1 hypothetical protein SDRG_07187 [Saprolegnia diclina VS20]|eukprot:XP_008611229.1 hypothetical protein SDRG_07187 [Saprolegnia diclina VS20]